MCAVLLEPHEASSAELKQAIERKVRKFHGILNMPAPTRAIVLAAMDELDRRHT